MLLIHPDANERWVSVTEAAALEGQAGRAVNKSSISRFLDRNPDVPVKRDANGRVKEVEYVKLAEARSQSLSVQDSRAAMPAAVVTPMAPQSASGSRKRQLEERKLELDLAEREGGLLDRAAIVAAVEGVMIAFNQGMERRRRAFASAMLGQTDLRSAELAIKANDRQLLEQLSRQLRTLAEDEAAPAAEEPEAA